MAARIVEGLFTCTKRWDLEKKLLDLGHKWPLKSRQNRAPLCAAELVIRILCWLDLRGDPHGRMYDITPADIEHAAQWTGKPGALVSAMIATHWIDQDPQGMRWHGYGSLNGLTLRDRAKKHRVRGDKVGDKQGDRLGDKLGDKVGDKLGASVSESGDPQRIPGTLRAREAAPLAPLRGLGADLGAAGRPERKAPSPAYLDLVRTRRAALLAQGLTPDPLPPHIEAALRGSS